MGHKGNEMNWKLSITFVLAIVFAVAGVACGMVDLRDWKEVDPTVTPGEVGVQVVPSDEPLTINQAKREVQVIRDDTNRWIEWRNADIVKEEAKVAAIEGFFDGGLAVIGETAGQWAGPFAPLATLLIGYATKRRKDKSPDQVAQEKQDSYNRGIEIGKAAAVAAFKVKAEKEKSDA